MANRMLGHTATAFLQACAEGSDQAYDQCKALLRFLECEETRGEARRLITELHAACETAEDIQAFESAYSFSLRSLTLHRSAPHKRLVLLQLPSTFAPEAWSFTFYEGIARYPAEAFIGKQVCELGCGNGWVSLALARTHGPERMTGVDINPKAVLTSKINLYVNGLDDRGEPIIDADGRCLLDKVRFEESDLLAHFDRTGQRLDVIVGCIPQVLSPDPDMPFDRITDQIQDDVLYALSNYAPSLGYLEDQFGLGLIAKALEQGIELLHPGGKVILNLGGRPGRHVLEHLFARRGYQCRRLWQTKVWQAEDTDIAPLVDIEKRSAHRFEFYVGLTSDQPISATTAQAFTRCGGRVAHALCVYEAELRNAEQVRTLFATLKRPAFQSVRDVLDLSAATPSIEDEKTQFLAHLCEAVQAPNTFHYDDPRGYPPLRHNIARFLSAYHAVPWDSDHTLILPNRGELIRAVLSTYVSHRVLVSSEFTPMVEQHAPHHLMQRFDDTMEVLEIPNQVDVTCRLIETLEPAMVITQLNAYENRAIDSVMRLLQTCGNRGIRLFLDISPYLDLSSEPEFNGVLAALSDQGLPPHASVFAGLVKNQVYENLQVCLLLSANTTLIDHLIGAIELGYSRTPILAQRYYACLFDDLLSFQMEGVRPIRPMRPAQPETPAALMPLRSSAATNFAHPSLQAQRLPAIRNVIRWDYGENEFPVPEFLQTAVLMAFAKRDRHAHECDPRQAIADLLAQRYGLDSHGGATQVMLGLGVAPIFAALAEHCQRHGKTLLMPMGAYGKFQAVSVYHGCPMHVIPTQAAHQFKLTPNALRRALKDHPGAWVYCCYPMVNPTGAVYSATEMIDLLRVCQAHHAGLLLNTLCHGLAFEPSPSSFHLGASATPSQLPTMVVMGGVSKEFAAGGLRFGYAWSNDADLAADIEDVLSEPHETVQLAVRTLLEKQIAADPQLVAHVESQRQLLQERAARLCDVLAQTGWEPLPPQGGSFLVASPTGLVGPSLTYDWEGQPKQVTLDASHVAEALFATHGLLINSDRWTGIPGLCRFVFSVSHESFEQGLTALKAFYRTVAGSSPLL